MHKRLGIYFAVAGLLISVAVGAFWWRSSRAFTASDLLQSLPEDRATHLYIDVAALRKAGVLDLIAGSAAEEESDYRTFVKQTGFNYRNDLNAVAAAFIGDNTYFALRGKFDWASCFRAPASFSTRRSFC